MQAGDHVQHQHEREGKADQEVDKELIYSFRAAVVIMAMTILVGVMDDLITEVFNSFF